MRIIDLIQKARVERAGMRFIPKNQVGVKRLYMIGPLDGTVKTTYGTLALRRRRAANKVARASRKANRG